jgi:predicted esterase
MEYDKIISRDFSDGIKIEYGLVKGSCSRVLLIKVGQNGTIYGYENKYLKMAKQINEKSGISIVVASNPYDKTDSLRQAIEIIQDECGQIETIYFMGHSNGAILGARYAHNHQEIKKLLLINGPLMINWPQTKKGLEQFQGESVIFIYGSKDPSYRYCGLIECINSNVAAELIIVEDADHNFSEMMDEFCELPGKYLLQK